MNADGAPDKPPMILVALIVLLMLAFVAFWIRQLVHHFAGTEGVSPAGFAGWLLTGLVVVILFAIGAILKGHVQLLLNGERAQGVVVGIDTLPGQSVVSPIVEFVTGTGERVQAKSRFYNMSTSAKVGRVISLVYDPADPKEVGFLLWGELRGVAFMLGFLGVLLMMWLSGILISEDPDLHDPLGLLPAAIAQFRLGPVRLPFFFLLSLVIPACLAGTYVTTRLALELRNGVKVPGRVTGEARSATRLSDGSIARGTAIMIEYRDTSGVAHTTRRALMKPLSRLKAGDEVEVLYRVRAPAKGVVNAWDELYFPPLAFAVFSLLLLALLTGVLSGAIQLPRDVR